MSLRLAVSPQKAREANRDLQIQLDQVLQEAQDPNSKGNSLFAEVKSKLSCKHYRKMNSNARSLLKYETKFMLNSFTQSQNQSVTPALHSSELHYVLKYLVQKAKSQQMSVCVCLLFVSQLEDKRAEMERQLISMKVQYQSLQKQHAFSKQQLQRMKVLCWTNTSVRNMHCCL